MPVTSRCGSNVTNECDVVQALDIFWRTYAKQTGTNGEQRLAYREYADVHVKMSKALKGRQFEQSESDHEAVADWLHDTARSTSYTIRKPKLKKSRRKKKKPDVRANI